MVAAVAAFAATNLDDLLLLVAWFAAGRYRTGSIVLGQFLGIGSLFAASLAASFVSLLVPASGLAWLGVVPMLLGLKMLMARDSEPSDDRVKAEPVGIVAVAAVTVVNGADNLGVYIPLFATSNAGALWTYAMVFAAMTALWCLAARWLVRHPAAGTPLRRAGPRAVPIVLIGIGLWILLR